MPTNYGWESELPALSALSDRAAADAIDAMTVLVPNTTPITYGSIAANPDISQTEYNVLRAVVAGACQQETAAGGYLINDMHQRMLTGLGIDPSSVKTVAMLEAFRASFRTALGGNAAGDALVTKLVAMGRQAVKKYPQGAAPGQVNSARALP